MAQPSLLLTPFASGAPADMVAEISVVPTPATPEGSATWSTGFPYPTMIPLVSGGKPPKGREFNGILKTISEHTTYQNKGGWYKFVAGVPYPKGSVLMADNESLSYISLVDNNTENPNTVPLSPNWRKWAGEVVTPLVLSDSVVSTLSTVAATSKAVKTAYDKGVEALNAANNAQTSANNAQATANAAIPKTSISSAIDSNSTVTVSNSFAVKTAYDRPHKAVNEVNNAITLAGLTLSPSDLTQLYQAIVRLSGGFVGQLAYSASATVIPNNWMVADGRPLNRVEYAELFSVIGTTYGGSGNTFNLPDDRAEFIRCADMGRGVDVGRGIGSKQGDAIRNIVGQFDSRASFHNASGAFTVVNGHYVGQLQNGNNETGRAFFDASNVVPTATENRPRNVAHVLLIKVK